ncbi:MAG: hypothetical protein Q8O64_12910 [Sideroxyarcus sp.]|nr:hypothetical protein [Sideroxyarcus sp.]
MMNGWKIQELRAAVLHDIRDFIPKDFYSNARTDDRIALKDSELAIRLKLEQYRTPKFTPRQLTAVWLLDKIGLYCHKYESPDPVADAADGITPESIKEMCLEHLHDALRRYAAHLGADEAKALMPANAHAKDKDVTTQKRQRQDALAVELDEILFLMETRTPAKVMAKLREQIGKPNTCILHNVGDGIEWENDHGDVKTLTIKLLGERIREWKKTV